MHPRTDSSSITAGETANAFPRIWPLRCKRRADSTPSYGIQFFQAIPEAEGKCTRKMQERMKSGLDFLLCFSRFLRIFPLIFGPSLQALLLGTEETCDPTLEPPTRLRLRQIRAVTKIISLYQTSIITVYPASHETYTQK